MPQNSSIREGYFAGEWTAYVIDHFLRPGAYARGSTEDERLAQFTFDHVVNRTTQVQGEDPGDVWQLIVRDNVVSTAFPADGADPEGQRAGVHR